MNTEWMDDCLHLKACRRLQKIAKRRYGAYFGRACNKECTAYEKCSGERTYTEEEVRKIINGTVRDVEYGITDPYDILPSDFV